jgi:5-methylcytosine-specific restriction endonuclease McrA
VTPDERRAYNRAWMERSRRARGVKPWSEHPKRVRVIRPRPPKRTPEEAKIARRKRYQRLRLELIAYQKAWAAANPEKVRISRALGRRARAARKRATSVGPVSYRRILKRDGFICWICLYPISGGTLREIHFDHIIPLSKGGSHTEDNIQVAHVKCNLRKHASIRS